MSKKPFEKFTVEGKEFAVELGLDTVVVLEKELSEGINSIMSCMAKGHLATFIIVILKTVKKATEVGFQSIEPEEVGDVLADQGAEFGLAFGRSVEALGNAYGLGKISGKD
jgi:hypothetical protein